MGQTLRRVLRGATAGRACKVPNSPIFANLPQIIVVIAFSYCYCRSSCQGRRAGVGHQQEGGTASYPLGWKGGQPEATNLALRACQQEEGSLEG